MMSMRIEPVPAQRVFNNAKTVGKFDSQSPSRPDGMRTPPAAFGGWQTLRHRVMASLAVLTGLFASGGDKASAQTVTQPAVASIRQKLEPREVKSGWADNILPLASTGGQYEMWLEKDGNSFYAKALADTLKRHTELKVTGLPQAQAYLRDTGFYSKWVIPGVGDSDITDYPAAIPKAKASLMDTFQIGKAKKRFAVIFSVPDERKTWSDPEIQKIANATEAAFKKDAVLLKSMLNEHIGGFEKDAIQVEHSDKLCDLVKQLDWLAEQRRKNPGCEVLVSIHTHGGSQLQIKPGETSASWQADGDGRYGIGGLKGYTDAKDPAGSTQEKPGFFTKEQLQALMNGKLGTVKDPVICMLLTCHSGDGIVRRDHDDFSPIKTLAVAASKPILPTGINYPPRMYGTRKRPVISA